MQNVESDFICVSCGETTREQIGELRAEESQSLIAKDLEGLRTCAIGRNDRFPSADAACVNGNDVDKNVAIFSLSVRVAVPIVRLTGTFVAADPNKTILICGEHGVIVN